MHATEPSVRHGDGPLWGTALALSLLANLVLLIAAGFTALESAKFRKVPLPEPAPRQESVAMIYPQWATPPAEPKAQPPPGRSFARTSEDQAGERQENAAFIGERDTRATSDRAPDANAPPLPSQSGREPRESEIETTESDYQDGEIKPEPSSAAASQPSASREMPDTREARQLSPLDEASADKLADKQGSDAIRSTPPVREKLLTGPKPVDVQVPRDTREADNIKPTPERRPMPDTAPLPETSELRRTVRPPSVSSDPAFRGFQRKTSITGSISRTGRSSLDVENTPLGRYQAAISRAVELEWQRNCVRYRDFITPGYLTVRFYVQPNGKVRSVQFDGDMATGEVQKGFTLNSVRGAKIPAMPAALKKEYDKEPLELVFRFYF